MVSVDEHTQVGIEIVSEGSKLTGELILKILQSVNDLLQRENDKQDFILKDNTKEGKQSIKDLVKKHSDGVMSFDDNLTKDQVGDYQKTFKKMGVDFSIVKNDNDSYSFFFASKDLNVIEKSLKNIIEKKNKEIENQKEIPVQSEIESQEIQLVNSLKELSPQELALFMKINEIEIANKNNIDSLNEFKTGLSNEQISNVENLYKENVFTGNDINTENKILSTEINEIESNLEKKDIQLGNDKSEIENKEKELQGKIKELSPKEQKLFNKMNELKELEEEIPNEKLMNIQVLHNEYSSLTSKSKEEQLDGIFQKLSSDEKEYFLTTNEMLMEPDSVEKVDKLLEVKGKLSSEQINKIDDLYDKNIHVEKDSAPKGKIHMNDVGKITANLTGNNKKNIEEPKLEFSTKEQQLDNIFNQLTADEKNLFMQLNKASVERLDNMYADRSTWKESQKLDELSGNFSNEEREKVGKLFSENIHTSMGDAPKGKIHMDEVRTVANNLTKEKQVDKAQSPKVFSVKGVQEIAKKIKEQEQDSDKDKKRSQTLSR